MIAWSIFKIDLDSIIFLRVNYGETKVPKIKASKISFDSQVGELGLQSNMSSWKTNWDNLGQLGVN